MRSCWTARRRLRGRGYRGASAAKRRKFFGSRRHAVATPSGARSRLAFCPRRCATRRRSTSWPAADGGTFGARALNSTDDEADTLIELGARPAPHRKARMKPNLWADKLALREHRQRRETSHSQLGAMGIQHLHARTNPGFELTVRASLCTMTAVNAF